MRLIDADALKDFYGRWSNKHTEFLKPEVDHYIDQQPTIDPESLRPLGKWLPPDFDFSDYWKCSSCREEFYFEYDPRENICNFCPNCGADMRERREEG